MLANTGSDIILTKNYSIRQKTQKTEMFFVLQKGNDLENSHQSFITQCVQHCSTSSFSVGSADVKNNRVVSKLETFKDLFRSLKFAT